MTRYNAMIGAVFACLLLSACGGGGSAQQGFMQVTQNAFDEGANKEPMDVEAIDIVFDINEDENAFDSWMLTGNFSDDF